MFNIITVTKEMKKHLKILTIAIVTGLFFLINFYVLNAVKTAINYSYFPIIFWSIVLVLATAIIYAVLSFKKMGMGIFFKIATHAFLLFFVSELVLLAVILLGDLYRFLVAITHLIVNRRFIVPTQSYTLIFLGIVLFLISIFLFLHGIISGKYAYRVIKHQLFFKDLPTEFDGFTITQISDVHAGSFKNAKAVQKGINLVKKQASDLFVFTGDLVNNKAEEIKPWLPAFAEIKAPFGQFSILGNHDYGDYVKWESEAAKAANLQQLKNYHANLGFKLLLDEHIVIQRNNQKVILVGVENWGLGFGERGNLQKALHHTLPTDFKILLSHDPSHWDAKVKNNPNTVHLTLAGHTHGMQFGLEAFGVKWSPVKFRYNHWAGIKQENNRFLNVNRGFGFIGFSGRVGIWPEITVIELKKG